MAESPYNTIFFGTPEFAIPIIHALIGIPTLNTVAVVTQPDKPVGRHHSFQSPPVKQLAEKLAIPVLQPEKISTPEFVMTIAGLHPAVVVVAAYGKIIPESLLAIPRHGWINIHASLLPKLRGASPIQHAILQGFSETGVTLMKMDATLDTGYIIAQEKVILAPRETFVTLHNKLARLGSKLLKAALVPYLNGKLTAYPQNDKIATYCSAIKKQDGLINWKSPAEQIDRHVRAMTPWPGAFTIGDGQTIKILGTEVLDETHREPSGTLHYFNGKLVASTLSGLLHITSLQVEGRKPMSEKEFLNGFKSKLPLRMTS